MDDPDEYSYALVMGAFGTQLLLQCHAIISDHFLAPLVSSWHALGQLMLAEETACAGEFQVKGIGVALVISSVLLNMSHMSSKIISDIISKIISNITD